MNYRDHIITITQDDCPENPRKQFDHEGTMFCWHRRYTLGDVQPAESPNEWFQANKDDGIVLPLYLYDHSGLTISTKPFECPWDSGQVGWIHMDAETIRREFGGDEGDAEKCLLAEVHEYDMYLQGNVYYYEICDSDGNHVDSCGGLYGYDYCERSAKESLDTILGW